MSEIKNEIINDLLYQASKKIILPYFKKLKPENIMKKSNNDKVTIVDIEVENYLKINLKKIFNDSTFIGEELFSKNSNIVKAYNDNIFCWTVDPIDGTNNYIKGNNKFCVMISFSFHNKILQSWIYNPITEDFCYAINSEGSYLNSKKLKTSNKNVLNESNGSISTKYWNDDNFYKIKKIFPKFNQVSSYGSIGMEYIDIAKGLRDFAILSKLSPWDHLPGILIVREAGGVDEYFDGGSFNYQYNKNNLIVTNNKELLKHIIFFIRG